MAEIDHMPNVSDIMKKVVKHFEAFVVASKYEPYDTVSQKGYWKQLTVRQGYRTGDLLIWTILHPQELNQEEMDQIKTEVKTHFQTFEPKVTSLNIQFFGQRQKGQPEPPVDCLAGEESIKEKLVNLNFKVSPQAFFQINTLAAEKLYETCSQVADLDKQNSVLFDVCCGTGTIGLCLASKVIFQFHEKKYSFKKINYSIWLEFLREIICLYSYKVKEVHGVDVVEEAVKDANINAEANGITNAKFHAGKAEYILPELLKKYGK